MIAHERAGKPPLLDFDYEIVLDARRSERPVNYALLRITRYRDKCLEDCLDLAKPPVMTVDPRAGHGPGIGGSKRACRSRIRGCWWRHAGLRGGLLYLAA